MELSVFAQHLPVWPDEDGGVVKRALDPLFGYQTEEDMSTVVRGMLSQETDGMAGGPLGNIGEPQPQLVAGGRQLGKDNQIHILLGTYLVDELAHGAEVVLNFAQLGCICTTATVISRISGSPYR